MDSNPENKQPLDLATLLPIVLGVFSLFGILLVLLLGRFDASRAAAPSPDTATPFQYLLIGTEPGIFTPETETPQPTPNAESPGGSSLVVTAQQGTQKPSSNSSPNSSSGNNPSVTKTNLPSIILTSGGNATAPIIILNPATRSPTSAFPVIFRSHTPTSTPGPTITVTPSRTKAPVLLPGMYDDSHPMLTYTGWESQMEPTAYQGTLHVSDTLNSTLTFRFTGEQIRILFRGGAGLGTMRINIMGLLFDYAPQELGQSNGTDEWVLSMPGQDTYNVTLTHIEGDSVNIDAIVID